MRVLVCGGRYFLDDVLLFRYLDDLHGRLHVDVLIHGAARGADSLAGQWANDRTVPVEVYPADWDRHRRRAGYLRNVQMLREGRPDLVVAFSGGIGTAMMVRLAGEAGVRVEEV